MVLNPFPWRRCTFPPSWSTDTSSGSPADRSFPSSAVMAAIWLVPALLSPSSTADPMAPDSMALRIALSSPEVLTPIMNSCPACCSVVRESAITRHRTPAGVGDGEGGAADASCDVSSRPPGFAPVLDELSAVPGEHPASAKAQAAAAARPRRGLHALLVSATGRLPIPSNCLTTQSSASRSHLLPKRCQTVSWASGCARCRFRRGDNTREFPALA